MGLAVPPEKDCPFASKTFVNLHEPKCSPVVIEHGDTKVIVHLDLWIEESGVEDDDFEDNVILSDGSFVLVKAGICYNEQHVTYAWLHKESLAMERFLTYEDAKILAATNSCRTLRRRLRYKNRKRGAAIRRLRTFDVGRLFLQGFVPMPISVRETG